MSEHPPRVDALSSNEIPESTKYEIPSLEQEEAIQRIAEIDERIRTLDIIRDTVKLDSQKPEDGFEIAPLPDLEKGVREAEDVLEQAYLDGAQVDELKNDLAAKKAEHTEMVEFEASPDRYMFNNQRGESNNRLKGESEERYSESTQALFVALEGLGLPRDEFIEAVNREGVFYVKESYRVRFVLDEFRSRLYLQRNTERLALPDGLIQMSAELQKQTDADSIDYNQLFFPNGEHRGLFSRELISVEQIYGSLPFADSKAFSEYPTEVEERFFTSVAKKILVAVNGGNSFDMSHEATSLGKDLSEIRIYGAERFRRCEDIEFDVKKAEKVLEYAKAEEDYLRMCMMYEKTFSIQDDNIDSIFKYDPEHPEYTEGSSLHWPVLGYEIKSEAEQIRNAGGTNGGSWQHISRWRNAMKETHEALKAELSFNKSEVDPLEIIIALRKTKDKLEMELEIATAEKEQLEMHNQYLQNLKGKQVSLRK